MCVLSDDILLKMIVLSLMSDELSGNGVNCSMLKIRYGRDKALVAGSDRAKQR